MKQFRHDLIDQDRDRVDVSAEHECEFWLKRFHVTFAELSTAVRNVGSRVSDLKIYFAPAA
jgi:hypothetical protein